MATKPAEDKALVRKQTAEDKAVKPADDKAEDQAEEQKAEPATGDTVKLSTKRLERFHWEPTGSDGKQAQDGPWRVRVQRLGASGLWRPLVEYVGDDYQTERAAEKALERLLR